MFFSNDFLKKYFKDQLVILDITRAAPTSGGSKGLFDFALQETEELW